MVEWLVRLGGLERDLRLFAPGVRDPWRVTEEDGKFYLQSARFEGLGDAGEVKRLADKFVDRTDLAALARFDGYQNVQTAEVVGLRPDGSPASTAFFSVGLANGTSTVSGSAIGAGAKPPPPPNLNKDTSLLKRQPLLEEALRHVREEPGWYGYWKANEALRREIKGTVVDRGWATADQYARFRKTINHHRHHNKPAPANSMKEHEVRSLLLDWLRKCLDWRLSGKR